MGETEAVADRARTGRGHTMEFTGTDVDRMRAWPFLPARARGRGGARRDRRGARRVQRAPRAARRGGGREGARRGAGGGGLRAPSRSGPPFPCRRLTWENERATLGRWCYNLGGEVGCKAPFLRARCTELEEAQSEQSAQLQRERDAAERAAAQREEASAGPSPAP
eukprot:gene25756-biopygen10544